MMKHGGKRPGSGRKRKHSRGVAHRVRENVSGKTPLHINFKYRTAIRNKDTLKLLKRAIVNARQMGLRVIHFSLQHNHIHLIAEADNNDILTRGMRSLTITVAKGLNKGRVQVARYHLHVLRTVLATKNAIRYVLFNQQRHEKGTYSKIDGYSSLLGLEKALVLIKKYARDKRITLAVGKKEIIPLEKGRSLLFHRGMKILMT